jgi:hypothetical protein
VPRHLEDAAGTAGQVLGPMPFQLLGTALDELVAAGVLPAERRPDAEYPVWSCVHGMAVLITRGPPRDMPEGFVRHVGDQLFAFITRGLYRAGGSHAPRPATRQRLTRPIVDSR